MTPGPRSAALSQRWDRHLLSIYETPTRYFTDGDGCRLTDVDGRTYLDLLGGLAVASTGHAHPKVVDAITHQTSRLLHVSNLYGTPAGVALAERLTTLTGTDEAFLGNSGGEANELALKLLRRHAHRQGHVDDPVVLTFEGSFHGRSMGALTLTAQPQKQEGFGPVLPGVHTVPWNDPEALHAAFAEHPVAGVFYEPIQGEGGIRPMTAETARTLEQLAREHGALLVADEVQTGVGRTGAFLASQHLGLDPHIVTLAKGLASGVPIGATLVRHPHTDLVGPGDHGCTFGGGPVASAAALATLEVLDDEDLDRNAREVGQLVRKIAAELPGVTEVRGRGLLLGLLLDGPDAAHAAEAAARHGVLVGTAGSRVLRLAPPLVLTPDDARAGLALLADALAEATP